MSENAKAQYRTRNWKQYNQALVNRGSITFWFDEETIQQWMVSSSGTSQRGRPRIYSDVAIRAALIMKSVFKLPYRALEGFIRSFIEQMGVELPTPHYSTFCDRAQELDIRLPAGAASSEPLHVIFDSTGLKIFGEGEWNTRKHGWSKRRTWRKVHVGLCAKTQKIVVAGITTPDVSDDDAMLYLLDAIPGKIEAVYGDGAYDKEFCREAIFARGGRQVIPPQKNARLQGRNKASHLQERDWAIQRIRELGKEGRKEWKVEVGYHKRSLVETAMYRLKQLFGERLSSRKLRSQATEVALRCQAQNRMVDLGIPVSYRLAF